MRANTGIIDFSQHIPSTVHGNLIVVFLVIVVNFCRRSNIPWNSHYIPLNTTENITCSRRQAT